MAKKGNEPPKFADIGQRLTQFIEDSGEPSARQFALKAGLAPQLVSNLAAGYSMPSGETLIALTAAYKSLDAMWLLTGRRTAKVAANVPDTTPATPEPPNNGGAVPANYGATVELAIVRARLSDRDTVIEKQAAEIARLNRELGKPSNGFDAAGPVGYPTPTAPRPTIGFRFYVSRRVKLRGAANPF